MSGQLIWVCLNPAGARDEWIPLKAEADGSLSVTLSGSFLGPLEKAVQHNVAVVGGADILGAALAPLNSPCTFRVEAAFSAAGILSATITQGGVTMVAQFNGGVALNVNSLYRFSLAVTTGDTINFRYSVNSNILSLKVLEIIAAAE